MVACAGVEIAVGARRVRNAGVDDGSTVTTVTPPTTAKKSSFEADMWLAQREAAKKMDVVQERPELNEVSSSQDNAELNSAKNSSFTEQTAAPKWMSSNWQESRPVSPGDHRSAAGKVEKSELYKHRSRSRSPVNGTKSAAETQSRKSSQSKQSSHSQVEHLRQLEMELEQRIKQRVSARMSSDESTAKPLPALESDTSSSPRHYRSYERELPLPVAGNSDMYQVPLKSALKRPPRPLEVQQQPSTRVSSDDSRAKQLPTRDIELSHRLYDRELPLPVASNSDRYQVAPTSALKHPASSSPTVESYAAKCSRELDVRQYQPIDRNIDYMSSVKNANR